MRLDLHIRGAFETLARPSASEEAFLTELQSRGLSAEDSQLALEKALLEGLLERLPDGSLRERSGSLAEEVRRVGPEGRA